MAFFSQGESRNKLMILFFLKEIDYAITRNEMYRVFAQEGWIDFFDFQTSLIALEEDAYAAAIPCAYGQGYRITPHGEEMLALFQEELPQSIREGISGYATRNRALLKEQSQFSAYQTQMPEGGYLAVLRLMEKDAHILDISLQLPSPELANVACSEWARQAEGIYQELIKRLLP